MNALFKAMSYPLQTLLDRAECPHPSAILLQAIIYKDLDLPPDTLLTKLHCQREILMGLFHLSMVSEFHQSFERAIYQQRGAVFTKCMRRLCDACKPRAFGAPHRRQR